MSEDAILRVANNSPSFQPLDPDYLQCSLPCYFDRVALQHAEKLAISDDETQYTYSQAYKKANMLAQRLVASGVKGHVAVLLPNCADLVIAFWGIMKAGCAAVMIDPAFPQTRRQFMMEDALVSAVVSISELVEQTGEVSEFDGLLIIIDDLGGITEETSPLDIYPDQPAVVVYTSGSTGKPKGVEHSHRAWMTSIGWVAQCEKYVPEDRIAQVYSPSSAASLIGIVYALLTGASVHIFDTSKHSLPAFVDWLEFNEITAFRMTGTAFRQVFAGKAQPKKMRKIRLAMIGGEMIHKEDHEIFKAWFPKTALQRVGGGATEVLLIASCYLDHKSTGFQTHMPMGYVFDPITVQIWDDQDQVLPANEIGEVIVRGNSVAQGYWNRDPSSGGFFPDPDNPNQSAYRMGDLGYLSDDGLLFLTGRKDQMVKVRGYRVEIAEVEMQLRHVEGVRQVVVVAVPHQMRSSRLIAYIEPDIQNVPSIQSIQSSLLEKLPEYMLPSRYIFLNQLPINASGKIDRLALPEPGSDRPDLDTPYAKPGNSMEKELAAIWSEVLGIEEIGIDDDFVQLGGDSLAAAQIFMMAEEFVNLKFPPAILINSPTIRQLAAKMVEYRSEKEDVKIVLQEGRPGYPTLFLFAPLFGDAIIFRDIVHHCPPEFRVIGFHSWTKDRQTYGEKSIDEMLDEFLPLLLAEQENGPFYLGGFSLGGGLAYQAAFRLRNVGKQIGFVFMMDSKGPGVLNKFDRKEYIQGFLKQKTLKLKVFYLRRGFLKIYQSVATKVKRYFSEKATTGKFKKEIQANREGQVQMRSKKANIPAEYIPYFVLKVPYSAPYTNFDVILFTSDDRELARKGSGYALGWDRVVKGNLKVLHLSGPHISHFRGENAKKIVDVLVHEIELTH